MQIKASIFSLSLIFSVFVLMAETVDPSKAIKDDEEAIFVRETDQPPRSPRLMLFTCNYGSGHKMATQGILESLPDCDTHVVDIYDGPLKPLDLLGSLSPKMSNEQFYNSMIKKEYNGLLNLLNRVVPKMLTWQRKKAEKLLSVYIAKHKPDLLISCVPLVNSILLSTAQRFNIPLLVITTDIDISAFCYGFSDSDKEALQKLRITVPYAKEDWYGQFGKDYPQALQETFQYHFGYPTRHAFSESIKPSVFDQLRMEYEIQNDENLILIMMGGNAGQAAQTYGELLLDMENSEISEILNQDKDKIHVICLCGDVSQKENRALVEKLNQLNDSKKNSRIRIHGCPGTPKIAELASLPELCTVISKPGGGTVNEMIKKKIPMVYHISETPLDWERGNMEYGETHKLGKRFQTVGEITPEARLELGSVLAYTFALHKAMRSDPDTVPESRIDFTHNLRVAVESALIE